MNLDFNEICRLCLRFCEKYVDLNQTNGVKSLSRDLAEKIKFCYLIQMDLSEGLPTKVCYECIQVISCFFIAKKNVVISEQLLRDVLYVKKKLQDEANIHKEENVAESDVNIKPEKQKTSQSLLALNSQPQNTINNIQLNYSNHPESKSTLNVNCKKVTPMPNNSIKIVTTTFKQNSDFKINKKKKLLNENNELGKSLSEPNNKSEVSVEVMDLKKLRSQSKRNPKSCKVNAAEKEGLKTDTTFEEYVVKEIGTVIDTSNILSPSVKRTRKSVLARSS